MASAPFRVFYSYSHADIKRLERLRKHLAMLRRDGMIAEWHDRDVETGSEWRQEIERELDAADVILLLVSASLNLRPGGTPRPARPNDPPEAALLGTALENMAKMREDMLRAVAQNFRADSTEPDS